MCRKTFKGAAALGLAAALVAVAGCQYDDSEREARRSALTVSPYENVKLSVEPSRREAIVGEVITLTAQTENLLGRNATIQWTAPAGDLRTQEDGRIARVIFEEPGTYSVTARLFIDEFEVRRDTETITVRPVP